ncbi:uncharacterized protein LY89DRAFT_539390, partial [Mollisia scopiformis]
EDAYEDEDDEDDGEGLSLRRFESATAKPPRMIEDVEGADEDEEDEPRSPPLIPSEELEAIMEGADNEDLPELYGSVKKCPCHGKGHNAPDVVRAWDVPQTPEHHGRRIAVVQVA